MNQMLFLGTGAADWEMSDKAGGFFRRNSAALINDDLLLDCGAHIFDFAQDLGDGDLYRGVTDILITHPHSDHYSADSIRRLAGGQRLRVVCDGFVKNQVGEHENIEYISPAPYQANRVGAYQVIPVFANHQTICDADKRAYHYIIKTPDGRCVFYGLDGAWFLCPTWSELVKHKFDVMVLDCTVGDSHDWRIFEHNTIPMLRHMVREIYDRDLISRDGCIVASHLARTLHKSHEDTRARLEEIGMLTAFDGMKIAF